jgi:tetratricopeptide (TPR) repeat protein
LTKPTIITTRKPLPFHELSPSEFERLCLWLVDLEGYTRVQHFGEAGSEQGRDVIAYERTVTGEQLTYFQCKRYNKINLSILKRDVDKFAALIKSDPVKRPANIVFVTNATVSAHVRDHVENYCRENGLACEFWARTELDMRVKKHSRIVTEFFDAARTPPITTQYQLPAPVPDFVGRQEHISVLSTALRTGPKIAGISGMGGIGKTQLALLVANLVQDDYFNAQIFIDMRRYDETPTSTTEALVSCIRCFGELESDLPDDVNELRRRYLTVLHGKRVLVVLDNACNAEQLRLLLPPNGCGLLITSRRAVALPGILNIHLDQLKSDEAVDLMCNIAPHVASEIASNICQMCGYLPLAIRAAGSLLAVTADMCPIDYASQLRNERTRLERIGTEGVDLSVESSFNLSVANLELTTLRVLRELTVFPRTFDAQAEEQVCVDAGHVHLSDLVRRSLLSFDRNTKRYQMHDLMRLFVRKRTRSEVWDATKRHATYYLKVLTEANTLCEKGRADFTRGLRLFDLERTNIQTGQLWAADNTERDRSAAILCNSYAKEGWHLFEARLKPRDRARWSESGLIAARKLRDRPSESAHLNHLGVAFKNMGDMRQAIRHINQALDISRELGDRGAEGLILINLANAYSFLGKKQEAIELYERSLVSVRSVSDRRSEGKVLGALGLARSDIGEARTAIALFKRALLIVRETGDRRNEGTMTGNLGMAYWSVGETDRASHYLEKAVNILREIGDWYSEAIMLGNLGSIYARMGKQSRALELTNSWLKSARLSGDRHGECSALGALGSVYLLGGEKAQATKLFTTSS